MTSITIVFIILKLCDVIDWQWWAVLLPLCLDVLILVLCMVYLSFNTKHKEFRIKYKKGRY